MLTLSLGLVLVLHLKGSTVNWSLIGSDMPSALGLVNALHHKRIEGWFVKETNITWSCLILEKSRQRPQLA